MLARVDSKFYHGLQTTHTDHTVAVFFQDSSTHFYQIYDKDNINQVVYDGLANLSTIALGARVAVESSMDYAVPGTVVKKYFNQSDSQGFSNSRYILTVQLDTTGENQSVSTQRVWFLPFQLENKGEK